MPAMTDRQESALQARIAEVREQHGVAISDWSLDDYNWRSGYEPEYRPGRGHDIDFLYLDGEIIVQIRIDVYGGGTLCIGETIFHHNSSDDECWCTPCVTDRTEDDA